jgi:hypothetical protein
MGWVLALIIFAVVTAVLATQRRCDVCGRWVTRGHYTWSMVGKKQTLCSSCYVQKEKQIVRDWNSRPGT